ncbi:unnamed protein product [Brachionus calyciflorus]|uniref:Uncharacterized protein n=1 Tax=Brachionus calyciflorus TaxID=104777 RepID=A0A814FNH1_9BILA|nr:unnamed protein product [Brachionus calyciflorus]
MSRSKKKNFSKKKKTPKSTFYYREKKKRDAIESTFNNLYPDFEKNDKITKRNFEELDDTNIINFSNDSSDCEKTFSSNFSRPTIDDYNLNEFTELLSEKKNQDHLTDEEIFEQLKMCCLSLFYTGKMTQDCLTMVLKLIRLSTNLELPTNFREQGDSPPDFEKS